MKEEWENKSVILSGSSMTRIFAEVRVPVGRVEYLRLFPYSFREFLRACNAEHHLDSAKEKSFTISPQHHQDLLSLFNSFLAIGGLPEVVNSYVKGEDAVQQQNRKMEIYLSQAEDFQRKQPAVKQHLFGSAIQGVANTLGFPFSLSRISNNHRDAKKILELLAAWHLVLPCSQRSVSITSTKSHPKYYLYDIGLARQLRETTTPSLSIIETINSSLRTGLGGLIENVVYLDLVRGKGFLQDTNGWKSSPKRPVEVDFIHKTGEQAIPIEVKAATKVSSKYHSSILEYLRQSGGKLGILATAAPFSVVQTGEVKIINWPVYAGLSENLKSIMSGKF